LPEESSSFIFTLHLMYVSIVPQIGIKAIPIINIDENKGACKLMSPLNDHVVFYPDRARGFLFF